MITMSWFGFRHKQVFHMEVNDWLGQDPIA